MSNQGWIIAMEQKLEDAQHRRCIPTVLKNFCNELLEIGDTEFDLIYSGSRMQYKGIIFRGELGVKTMAHILKNYGKQVFLAVKSNKRI